MSPLRWIKRLLFKPKSEAPWPPEWAAEAMLEVRRARAAWKAHNQFFPKRVVISDRGLAMNLARYLRLEGARENQIMLLPIDPADITDEHIHRWLRRAMLFGCWISYEPDPQGRRPRIDFE